ncbi:serine/threonine protein phosphatase [Streptomyces tateyamensis]|uniref:Serine/threonine protein phosphatase n=2 Tax=Streptomyces tateyamensis TaxID=565073 RepID=A0A2V4MVD0_9ACTN|nr:serine/threonine protein phosphatase [Streptomyces tateyamensis]
MAPQHITGLGIGAGTVYLADPAAGLLRPLTGGPALPIEGTTAGSAHRERAVRAGDGEAWFPLVDGEVGLGVLGVRTAALDRAGLRRCTLLAALLAMVITAQRDAHALPAELLRALLPPSTVYSSQVLSTAVLEPAQELGGDAFDHSLAAGALHAAVLDASGGDLAAGLGAAVALAACRNARRCGAELPELVVGTERALARWFPERAVGGVFLRLELASGLLRWVGCGLPTPLLIRRHQLVPGALERPPEPPLGGDAAPRELHTAALDPGDLVLVHTDGAAAGLGTERLVELVVQALASGAGPGRALTDALKAAQTAQAGQSGQDVDDATALLVEWQPPAFQEIGATVRHRAERTNR